MARPKKAARKTADLSDKIDLEVTALLDLPKDSLVIETRLAILQTAARWAGIRNKLGDAPEQEDLLGAYRRNIEAASEAVERAGTAGKRGGLRRPPENEHSFAGFESGNPDRPYNGGPALEALKSRLPGADDGDADGDSRGGSSENPVIAGANRLIRPRLSSDDAIDFDEPHSDGDI